MIPTDVKFTDKQRRVILEAVAAWEPFPTEAEEELLISTYPRGLAEGFNNGLRDEIAIALAPVLGIEQEQALVIMQATRMTL